MTELDQTSPDTSRHAERQPSRSYDGEGYPSGQTAADTDPAYYDGDTQAAIAADTVPSRQEAARQDAAGYREDQPGRDPGPDGDLEAILHQDDHLPDPRTRQQAARDDAALDGNTIEYDSADADQQPRSGPDPLAQAASPETSPDQETHSESPTGLAQPDSPTPNGRDPRGDQEPLFTTVMSTAEMRTLGDTTPIGIGLKPTGEQLEEMEHEDDSPLSRMRHHLYKDMDDVTDALKENGETVVSLFDRPPSETHAGVSRGHHETTRPAEHGVEGGEVAVAGLLVGVLAYEGARRIKNMVGGWRGRRS